MITGLLVWLAVVITHGLCQGFLPKVIRQTQVCFVQPPRLHEIKFELMIPEEDWFFFSNKRLPFEPDDYDSYFNNHVKPQLLQGIYDELEKLGYFDHEVITSQQSPELRYRRIFQHHILRMWAISPNDLTLDMKRALIKVKYRNS